VHEDGRQDGGQDERREQREHGQQDAPCLGVQQQVSATRQLAAPIGPGEAGEAITCCTRA
jgi:hypothetical protein